MPIMLLCRKCLKGFIVSHEDKVLPDGTVATRFICDNAECGGEEIIIKPWLHQKKRKIKVPETREEYVERLRKRVSGLSEEQIKRIRETLPEEGGYRIEYVPVGEPYLVHDHGNYGDHPITRKHRE